MLTLEGSLITLEAKPKDSTIVSDSLLCAEAKARVEMEIVKSNVWEGDAEITTLLKNSGIKSRKLEESKDLRRMVDV